MYNLKKYFCIVLLACFWTFVSYAAETTIEIKQETADRKKARQEAINQVSFELMESIMGADRMKEKKNRIEKIISKSFNRYILYTQAETPVRNKEDASYTTSVKIGFSEENLKKILLEEDLFYSGTSYLKILPLMLYQDMVDRKVYGWWRNKSKIDPAIKEQMSHFYNQVQLTLMSYGFFLSNPEWVGTEHFVPKSLFFTKASKKNVFNLARFLQAHLVMTGSIKIRESDIEEMLNVKVEITVYQTDKGRVLAEVERFEKIQIDKKKQAVLPLFLKKNQDFAKSIGVQLKSIYEAGQISSDLLKITVKGALSYRQMDKFQKLLSSKVKDIKDLQENIVRTRSTTYIANTSTGVKQVSKKIKETSFPGFLVKVSEVRKKEIILEVRKK